MNNNILDNNFEDESNEELNAFNSHKPQLRERPPRHLSQFTKITLLNGGLFTQMGWGLLGFGMVFFWIFVLQSEAKYLLSFDGNWQETTGVVQEIHATNAEVDGRAVLRYVFSYSPAGETLNGDAYSSSAHVRIGDAVTVKYKSGNHQRAKIEGMTSEVFPFWVIFVIVFPIIGFLLLLRGLYLGKKKLNLLINGKFTYGKKLSRIDSGSRVNNNIVWTYEFSFKVNNRTYIAKCTTHKAHLVEDESKEVILYLPDNPDDSTVFDAIPGVPKVNNMGRLESAAFSNIKYLIIPILSILLNIIIAYFML